MSDAELHMWSHWRDKSDRGFVLVTYYPKLLRTNFELQQALAAIRNADRAIDKIMEELNDKELDLDR